MNIIGNPDESVAVDYTVNAAVGFPLVTGSGNNKSPVNHVFPGWDVATGYAAAMGVLAAERYRNRTGKGQQIKLLFQMLPSQLLVTLDILGKSKLIKKNDQILETAYMEVTARILLQRTGEG